MQIYRQASNLEIVGKEIHSLELNYGCDGKRHAILVTKVFMDNKGNVVHADCLGDVFTGQCDGSCKEQRNLGSFTPSNEIRVGGLR